MPAAKNPLNKKNGRPDKRARLAHAEGDPGQKIRPDEADRPENKDGDPERVNRPAPKEEPLRNGEIRVLRIGKLGHSAAVRRGEPVDVEKSVRQGAVIPVEHRGQEVHPVVPQQTLVVGEEGEHVEEVNGQNDQAGEQFPALTRRGRAHDAFFLLFFGVSVFPLSSTSFFNASTTSGLSHFAGPIRWWIIIPLGATR